MVGAPCIAYCHTVCSAPPFLSTASGVLLSVYLATSYALSLVCSCLSSAHNKLQVVNLARVTPLAATVSQLPASFLTSVPVVLDCPADMAHGNQESRHSRAQGMKTGAAVQGLQQQQQQEV